MTLNERIEALRADAPGFWQRDACGVTRSEREIPVLRHGAEQPPAGERLHLVLVGGLSGQQEDTEAALAALKAYRAAPGLPARFALSAVPCGNPDGLALGRFSRKWRRRQPEQRLPAAGRELLRRQSGGALPLALAQLRGGRTWSWKSALARLRHGRRPPPAWSCCRSCVRS